MIAAQHVPNFLLSSPGLRRGLLPLLAVACLFGCRNKTQTDALDRVARYEFPAAQAASFDTWASGQEAAALSDDVSQSSVEALFMQAEIDFWAGDVERAFERHAEVIATQPGSPLVRLSAARINDLADDVVDFESRLQEKLAGVTFGEVHPLAAAALSAAGQQARLNSWRSTRAEQPFEADALGFPVQWHYTPVLSFFRLSDFDTPFSPETEPQLAATYLSPQTAEDVPINRKPSYPFVTSNISLSPDLGKPGIYYLETFATVNADEPQVYWVYGNFAGAARLWIDGKEVIERREENYSSGKRWRRIKLEPGTHRILLKLAYQSGYRDWFDLNFLNKNGTIAGGSALTFSKTRPGDAKQPLASMELLSETKTQVAIDPFIVHADQVAEASDEELYLGALAAHYDRDGELFDMAYEALIEHRPEFAAAFALKSLQVRTLWEVPGTLRDDTSLKLLRQAQTLHPESVRYAMRLGNRLKKKGESRETEALLRQAAAGAIARPQGQDARLRNSGALNSWAYYLEGEGWNERAETAYREVLSVAPSNCGAASSLQSILYARNAYLEPEQITPRAERCPSLYETWLKSQPEAFEQKLELERREAQRYPYNSSAQIAYVRALQARGQIEQADAVLRAAIERMPWSQNLLGEQVDRAFASKGLDAALELLDAYEDVFTNSSWIVWKRAMLTGELPLTDLMRDAQKVAVELAKKEPVSPVGSAEAAASNSAGDEAFYVIDFAAKKYFEDGTGLQLTHTLVRVMTKNAIDRFGELSVPNGARLIHARTIKQDGTIQTPVSVSGKDTLSMPGLAEGDFVELAYLQYDSAYASSRTHREGTRFFFRMQGISSLNSEYVIINPTGEVMRFHDAPEPQEFTYNGEPAVRFLRTDSPRPRSEPGQLSADEFLPWVQLVREGSTMEKPESMRLFAREQILDSMRLSAEASEVIDGWIEATQSESRDQQIKDLYYTVTEYFTDTRAGFGTEVSHAILEREGNPMLALKAAYDKIGVSSEIYLMRSKYASPLTHPMFTMTQYGEAALRVEMPGSGEAVWLASFGQDAMFGTLMPHYVGESAVCISCASTKEQTLPAQGIPMRRREQRITATLQPDGTLTGTIRHTYDGDFAMSLRELFRKRQEPRQRDIIMENLTVSYIPGATVTGYEFEGLEDRDSPLTLVMNFSREQFARKDGSGALLLEASLFSPGLERGYATLPERTTPMLLGRPQRAVDVLEIKLPKGLTPTLRSPSGTWTLESPFGTYKRGSVLEDGTFTISSDIDMGIQRLQPEDYAEFQKWAQATEQSSVVLLTLK